MIERFGEANRDDDDNEGDDGDGEMRCNMRGTNPRPLFLMFMCHDLASLDGELTVKSSEHKLIDGKLVEYILRVDTLYVCLERLYRKNMMHSLMTVDYVVDIN
ncbi:hypothetical protein LOAG_10986 [Loa loa]|uniref:Uncharacterized protein n=1 Tax=Loa loa TaxID=7209 RepID=A0A1S0TNV5_LOALO|nr:hypothetical protein LOAG_10986 [Loa loa]EFO17511.1 hypothetical protein LOAG_10986 [Loa loa]